MQVKTIQILILTLLLSSLATAQAAKRDIKFGRNSIVPNAVQKFIAEEVSNRCSDAIDDAELIVSSESKTLDHVDQGITDEVYRVNILVLHNGRDGKWDSIMIEVEDTDIDRVDTEYFIFNKIESSGNFCRSN